MGLEWEKPVSADYDQLRAFLLASTKAHLGNRYAISLLKTQIGAINDRLDKVAPVSDPQTAATLNELKNTLDQAIEDLDDRTDALLSALEVYVNG